MPKFKCDILSNFKTMYTKEGGAQFKPHYAKFSIVIFT